MRLGRQGAAERKPARYIPRWVVWALGAAFTIMAVLSALVVYTSVRDMIGAWSGQGLPALFTPKGDSGASQPEDSEAATEQPTPTLETRGEAWNGTDRVNILVMGLDFRDWSEDDGPARTDTMMLVTIDPIAKTAGMLSIPRDLWVEIPGFEHNRINTAYFLGESYRLPGGGPGLAMQTVEKLLGVPVQYYAVIEFEAFERMIDEIGGLEIQVFERMKISPIGRSSLWLEVRSYRFNGAFALAYARARKTEGGDFDRATRQQQVLLAIRDQVIDLGIPTLLAKAPAVYSELSAGIHTNLSFDQMVALGLLAMQVDVEEDVRRGVIAPPEQVLLETHPDGAQVLKPIPDKVRLLRDEIFTGTGAIRPSYDLAKPEEAAQLEGARVAVLNGAGVEGLATETSEYLREQGLNVVEIANADRLDYEKSRVIVNSQNFPYTLRYLAELLDLSEGQILRPVFPRGDVDLEVILGVDWVYSRP